MSTPTLDVQPAAARDVNVYMPYYAQGAKRALLPLAISLYQKGNLEGRREIEGGEGIPFLATWNISTLPADLTRCRMQFDGDAELSYEVTMSNFEFVGFLIEVVHHLKRNHTVDFSKAFYRKLLHIDD